MKTNDIILCQYENQFEAEIAKGRLADAGIIAIITKDDGGGMIPSLQNADGVQLIVQFSKANEARTILGLEYEKET